MTVAMSKGTVGAPVRAIANTTDEYVRRLRRSITASDWKAGGWMSFLIYIYNLSRIDQAKKRRHVMSGM